MSQFISQTELFPKQMLLREIEEHESDSWSQMKEGRKEQKCFLEQFYELEKPKPFSTCDYDARNLDFKADLKLILEIYTNSRLKMSQDKKIPTRQLFYCRNSGKDCFKIEVDMIDHHQYRILNDYQGTKHRDGCEVQGEDAQALKIYNLMMLKRDTIEQMMRCNNLLKKSPEAILCAISNTQNAEYFYMNAIKSLQNRKKLKKRFDNIINISIKKKIEEKAVDQGQLSQKQHKLHQQLHRKPKQHGQNRRYRQKCPRGPQKTGEEQYDKQNESVSMQNMGKPIKKIKIDHYGHENMSQSINNSKKSSGKQSQIYEQSESEEFDANKAMNEIQDHSGWMLSDQSSIAQAITAGQRLRMDDLFASIRNSLIRSLERSSLKEIEENLGYKFG